MKVPKTLWRTFFGLKYFFLEPLPMGQPFYNLVFRAQIFFFFFFLLSGEHKPRCNCKNFPVRFNIRHEALNGWDPEALGVQGQSPSEAWPYLRTKLPIIFSQGLGPPPTFSSIFSVVHFFFLGAVLLHSRGFGGPGKFTYKVRCHFYATKFSLVFLYFALF